MAGEVYYSKDEHGIHRPAPHSFGTFAELSAQMPLMNAALYHGLMGNVIFACESTSSSITITKDSSGNMFLKITGYMTGHCSSFLCAENYLYVGDTPTSTGGYTAGGPCSTANGRVISAFSGCTSGTLTCTSNGMPIRENLLIGFGISAAKNHAGMKLLQGYFNGMAGEPVWNEFVLFNCEAGYLWLRGVGPVIAYKNITNGASKSWSGGAFTA